MLTAIFTAGRAQSSFLTNMNNKTLEPLSLKVTKIGSKWVAQLNLNGEKYDQMACNLKSDVGWICREMLRWYSKLGGISAWAESARKRQHGGPTGKVWYQKNN